MNKAALCEVLATDMRSSKAGAERALNAVLEGIVRGLRRTGEVSLVGFGSFRVRPVKPRSVVNPRTGARIRTRAGRTVKFRPGKGLRSSI
ncbi:MAG: HU family DNA-binding protein [Planctomycetes bacterium]|nr:HU family DNA-binding protein [Planctomycetota bacterium]